MSIRPLTSLKASLGASQTVQKPVSYINDFQALEYTQSQNSQSNNGNWPKKLLRLFGKFEQWAKELWPQITSVFASLLGIFGARKILSGKT